MSPDLAEVHEQLNALLDEGEFEAGGRGTPLSGASFQAPEQKFEQMQELCARFHHPELAYPTFHVAGSKGKGSVSAYLASILEAAGYKVGRLSSPYVAHFGERFQCGNWYFSEEEYRAALEELKRGLRRRLPHSILMTLYALILFRVAKCDFAVVEVGIGGRLDPTNVVRPEVSIITSIELEHQRILGNTLAEIASEKAGIIKEGTPVVVAKQKPEAEEVILKVAKERRAEVFRADEVKKLEYFYDDSYDELSGRPMMRVKTEKIGLDLRMLGDFQAENALLAVKAIEAFAEKEQFAIRPETIHKGVREVALPGRFDARRNIFGFEQIPYLVIDGAHTVNSVRGSLKAFREVRRLESVKNAQDSCLTDFCPGAEPLLLFSTASDKVVEEMAAELKTEFKEVILTTLEYKKVDVERMERAFQGLNEMNEAKTTSEDVTGKLQLVRFIEEPREAVLEALKLANNQQRPLLVIGSMYLAGTAYRILEEKQAEINKIIFG